MVEAKRTDLQNKRQQALELQKAIKAEKEALNAALQALESQADELEQALPKVEC